MQHTAMRFSTDLAQSMLAGEAAQTVEVRRLGASGAVPWCGPRYFMPAGVVQCEALARAEL
jgi:hypothetical protein